MSLISTYPIHPKGFLRGDQRNTGVGYLVFSSEKSVKIIIDECIMQASILAALPQIFKVVVFAVYMGHPRNTKHDASESEDVFREIKKLEKQTWPFKIQVERLNGCFDPYGQAKNLIALQLLQAGCTSALLIALGQRITETGIEAIEEQKKAGSLMTGVMNASEQLVGTGLLLPTQIHLDLTNYFMNGGMSVRTDSCVDDIIGNTVKAHQSEFGKLHAVSANRSRDLGAITAEVIDDSNASVVKLGTGNLAIHESNTATRWERHGGMFDAHLDALDMIRESHLPAVHIN